MGWYERVVFRRMMERVLGRPPVREERRRALAPARGSILEVGIGTGMNLDVYPDGTEAITALAYETTMDPRARTRAAGRGIGVRFVAGDARLMPFADASFDTVVCTFLLCSIPDGAAAVREFRRVLRPDGRLLFLEHVAHRSRLKRSIQHVLNPISLVVSCGCSLIRDSRATIEANGFHIEELADLHVEALMWPHRHVIRGTASPVAVVA